MYSSNRYLFLYLILVFVLSWTILFGGTIFADKLAPIIGELTLTHPLVIFVLCLPSISGLIIYFIIGGFPAIKSIFLKIIPRKKDLFWFPVLLEFFILFDLIMHYGSLFFGVGVPEISYTPAQMIAKALGNFIEEIGLLGGVFGWVAFLLPFLQRKLKNNILSGLLTGFLFGLWVFPGYGISSAAEAASYLLYVIQLMIFFVFYSYIFNITKGNLGFYIFAFWLAATGSHIQMYYFNVPVQIMQIVFLIISSFAIHFIFKKIKADYSLQIFPNVILGNLNDENCENYLTKSTKIKRGFI